jgi:hypothetical protein
MKNYDYWKKSQITDISTFCYWLHQKGVGIYAIYKNTTIITYALIVHNFLYFPKAPDPIKEKSWK